MRYATMYQLRMTPADRLRAAREGAGFATAADAVRRFGWGGSTYFGHENGSRGITAAKAGEYAKAYRVTPKFILFGSDRLQELTPADKGGDMVPVLDPSDFMRPIQPVQTGMKVCPNGLIVQPSYLC